MFFGVRTMMQAPWETMAHPHPVTGVCFVDEEKPPEGGAEATKVDPAADGQLEALKAERVKRQAVEAKLAEFEAAQEAAKVAAAEEQGKFQELYGTAKTRAEELEAKVQAYEAAETARLEARKAEADAAVAALPENLRDLVPDSLDPDARLKQAKAVAAIQPGAPTGTMGGGGGKPPQVPDHTEAERAEAEAMIRMRPNMTLKTALSIVKSRKKKS